MGLLIFIAALALAGLQVFVYYGDLPATLATHFTVGGTPNGWMSREVFVAFYFGILLVILGSFVGVGALLEKKIGPHLVNIPNKQYWLAPERAAETMKTLRQWMYAVGAFCAVFIIALYQMLIELNTSEKAPVLDEHAFLWGMGFFLAVMAVFTVGLLRRFRRPDPVA